MSGWGDCKNELYGTKCILSLCSIFAQEHLFSLKRELEEAHKAIEEGNALEPVLRRNIKTLEEDKKDLMV